MGGAVSSGESNDDLIDNLMEANYIKTVTVERVFRAVDRGLYYTDAFKTSAYKDVAWKDGNLHLSAPCIYSEVMENLELKPGMSFLNIGSGTGYLSTMCGLIVGHTGINHGIELYPEVVEYAREKVEEFIQTSPAIDMFDFCVPEFVTGNCLDPLEFSGLYDRIYCGAACPEESIRNITDLLKIGGICVIPVNDSLVQITRLSENTDNRKCLLPVSFATLISPKHNKDQLPKSIRLPEWKFPSLKELCRSRIRSLLREDIEDDVSPMKKRKKRRRRRQERNRATSRLLVVQRRRAESGVEDAEAGFVAVAYSLGEHSSEDASNPEQPSSEDEVSSSDDRVMDIEEDAGLVLAHMEVTDDARIDETEENLGVDDIVENAFATHSPVSTSSTSPREASVTRSALEGLVGKLRNASRTQVSQDESEAGSKQTQGSSVGVCPPDSSSTNPSPFAMEEMMYGDPCLRTSETSGKCSCGLKETSDDSCAWSTASSLDSSPTISTTSEDDRLKPSKVCVRNRASASTESGVATDSDKKEYPKDETEMEKDSPESKDTTPIKTEEFN